MNLLLFVTILFLLTVNFAAANWDLLAPGVIVCIMFALSSFVLLLSGKNWHVNISIVTFLVITVSLVLFSAGSKLGTMLSVRQSGDESTVTLYDIKKTQMFCFNLISFAVVLIYARHQYEVSVSLGNTYGYMATLSVIRWNMMKHPEALYLGNMLNMGVSYVRAIGYIAIYLLVARIITCKSMRYDYLFSMVCLVAYNILTTGRSGFISFLSVVFFDIYIISKNLGRPLRNKVIFKYGAGILLMFLAFFWLLGMLVGKNKVLSLEDTMAIYIGSSIACLNHFLKNYTEQTVFTFRFVFAGITNIVSKYVSSGAPLSNHSEMVQLGHYSSNVYTSLYPYLRAGGGVVFLWLAQALVGVLYGYGWKRYNCTKHKSLLCFFYGRFFGAGLAMYAIAEELISQFAMNVMFELLVSWILIRYVVKEAEEQSCIEADIIKDSTLY